MQTFSIRRQLDLLGIDDLNWVFDEHGALRSQMRGIPGALVQIVLARWQDERDGKAPGSVIRVGRI